MPVQTSYPGVYIEEIPSGVQTITGVATSIAAFFGRASKGNVNKAERILSLSDYERKFGKPHPKSDLAYSVRQFFANGGTDCYVIRLANGAKKASVTLKSCDEKPVLDAEAKMEGAWANTIRLVVDYKTENPDESFNLTVILEEDGKTKLVETFRNLSMNPTSQRFAPAFVTQSSDLIELKLNAAQMGDPSNTASFINDLAKSVSGFSQARRPLGADGAAIKTIIDELFTPAAGGIPMHKFEISVNDSPFTVVDLKAGTAFTNVIADIAANIKNKINDALGGLSPVQTVECSITDTPDMGQLLTITSASNDKSSVRVRRASQNDISAALMLGVAQGGIEVVRWSNFRPAPNAIYLNLGKLTPPIGVETVNKVSTLAQNAFNELKIDTDKIPLNNNLVTTAPGDKWFKSAPVPGSPHGNSDGVREKLHIMETAINSKIDWAGIPWRAEVWGYHLALIAKSGNLNTIPLAINTTPVDNSVFALNVINNGWLVNVRQYSLGIAGSGKFSSNGNDGSDGSAPTVADYVGLESAQTGFYALDQVDLFNLMVLPADEEVGENVLDKVWGPASIYSAAKRAFLIIDAPPSWTKKDRPEVVSKTFLINDLRSKVVKENSAVFYPRLKFQADQIQKYIGPSGVIAGLMSRIDVTRGVWKAPAGMEADLRGILKPEVKLTDMENGVLNKLAVNCIREFPGTFVNWGARTMDGSDDIGSEWKYIPIRRLALFIEESLYRGTKWVVFEPNDEPLWAKIRLNVGAFMLRLFRQGAFQGSTPDQAFYVKCDAETTPQADRDLGIVNIEVGFAPLKPAEFVIIKIQQMAGQL